MKKQRVKTPSLVIIAILTVITIAFWIAFNVFRTLTIKTPSSVPLEILSPLNPNLDSPALKGLQERIQLTNTEIDSMEAPEISSLASPEGEINE